MSRRRWIADEVSKTHAALIGQHAEHLVRVLRARVGEEFEIVADGRVRTGRIIRVSSDRVEFELGDELSSSATLSITVVLSIFKFDRMEWAIEKCVELGVASIIPAITQRTEPHLAAAASKRVERWRRIARQASEQSRRTSVPEISLPMKLKEALALHTGRRIVLAESEKEQVLKEALQRQGGDEVTLAFGPEGGWTSAELEMFRQEGWTAASLGNTILRAETAAIAAVAIVLAKVG